MPAGILEKLKQLREFLTKERWIQGAFATRFGNLSQWGINPVIITIESADDNCNFCLAGAIYYKCQEQKHELIRHLVKTIYPDTDFMIRGIPYSKRQIRTALVNWNDDEKTTFEDVQNLLNNTIQRLEGANNEGK